MSFRISALVAAVAVLGLSSMTPANAQPQAPVRPRYTQFQSMFGGGRPLVANPGQGILGLNGPGFVNPNGPNAPIFLNAAGQPITQPGQLAGPGTPNPLLQPTGVVGQFNNLGHWYPNSSGNNLGHWYPNGIRSGVGVLGGTSGGYGTQSGLTGGPSRTGGPSALGTTLLGAATVNQFRR